jgi:hypothetical protein
MQAPPLPQVPIRSRSCRCQRWHSLHAPLQLPAQQTLLMHRLDWHSAAETQASPFFLGIATQLPGRRT